MYSKSTLVKSFFRAYAPMTMLTFLAVIGANGLVIILPIYIAQSFNILFNVQSHRANILAFLPDIFLTNIQYYFILFILLAILQFTFDLVQRFMIGRLGEAFLATLRLILFKHQLNTPLRLYNSNGLSKYLLRYSGDLNSVQAYITKGIIRFSSDIILLFGSLIILFSLNSTLGWILLSGYLILAAVVTALNHILYLRSSERRNAKSGLLKFVNLRMQRLATIQGFNRINVEYNKYKKRVLRLEQKGIRYHQVTALIHASVTFGIFFITGTIIFVIYWLQQKDINLSPSLLFTALLVLITMMPVYRRCFKVSLVWRNGKISFDKLMAILNQPTSENDSETEAIIDDGRLCLENVPWNDGSLLSLECHPNTITFVVADNNSGKSSIVDYCQGLYALPSGDILINGRSIHSVSTKSWKKNISVVSDDYPLLGNKIFEAISYSRKASNRPMAQLLLDDLRLSPKLTLDTRISETYANLSSSEQKLLLFARAFMTRKKILIIDNPFTHLDSRNQNLIVNYLNKLARQSTVLIFASNKPPSELNASIIHIKDHARHLFACAE